MRRNAEQEECYRPVQRGWLDNITKGKKCPCGCGEEYSADNPLSFTGRCHQHAPTRTEYWDGVVSVRCAVCERLILRIGVAS